ncbi:hypothetical protein EYF80_056157 [Liparis tanakae]|uniref:Uncharacterized protein n=1 Tax=Liparis tanakae TaxID=230148 RepID=A0A4Z2EY04_9TELE|nr:hypothetical protein EYF80_056157 [Liparis tanakae]
MVLTSLASEQAAKEKPGKIRLCFTRGLLQFSTEGEDHFKPSFSEGLCVGSSAAEGCGRQMSRLNVGVN